MILLLISYDGTRYFGWQQTRSGPTIQESLRRAIFQITRESPLPEAASRTDRGVHAQAQVVAFALEKPWDPSRLQRGLNAVLPPDIRVLHAEMKQATFHPTLDAERKEYRYRFCLGPVQKPMHRLYSWHYRHPIDLAEMEAGARELIGQRDFSAFAGEREENPLCDLQSIRVTPIETHRLEIAMVGDRFLYKMARTIAGTLAHVGSGRMEARQLEQILNSKDRKQAGVTAPAHGLFLHRVEYSALKFY